MSGGELNVVTSLPLPEMIFERSEDRGYWFENLVVNKEYIQKYDFFDQVEGFISRSTLEFENRMDKGRFFVSPDVIDDVLAEFAERGIDIDFVADLNEFAGLNYYMVGISHAKVDLEDRNQIIGEKIIDPKQIRIDRLNELQFNPYEDILNGPLTKSSEIVTVNGEVYNVDGILEFGNDDIDDLSDTDLSDLYNIWEMFDWDKDMISSLKNNRLGHAQNKEFIFARNGDNRIVGAAVIEFQDIEIIDGDEVHTIRIAESSEWGVAQFHPVTGERLRSKGLGKAMIAEAHRRMVIRSHEDESVQHFAMIAEANLHSGAWKVANSTGLKLVNTNPSNAVIRENVRVNDNNQPYKLRDNPNYHQDEWGNIRDFGVFMMPVDVRDQIIANHMSTQQAT